MAKYKIGDILKETKGECVGYCRVVDTAESEHGSLLLLTTMPTDSYDKAVKASSIDARWKDTLTSRLVLAHRENEDENIDDGLDKKNEPTPECFVHSLDYDEHVLGDWWSSEYQVRSCLIDYLKTLRERTEYLEKRLDK